MLSATRLIHSIPVDEQTGAISVPIYATSTFVQEAPGINKGFDYARTGNPTRKILEDLIAKMENGRTGLAFSSGLAAIDAVLKLLRSGDEIVAIDDIYGGAFRLFTGVYEQYGIRVKLVDTADLKAVEAAISPATRLLWVETPSNPTLKISDITALATLPLRYCNNPSHSVPT
jgi:cystathionine beta-lyase